MAEPGSSSEELDRGGKVFASLGGLMLGGGGWPRAQGSMAARDDGARDVGGCCHRAGKDGVNGSEIWSGGERQAN